MSDRKTSMNNDETPIDLEQESELAELFRRTTPQPPSFDFAILKSASEPTSPFRRIPMAVRIAVPLAAVASIIALALIWQPSQVDANVTFAEMQNNLKQTKTISFRQKTISSGPPKNEENAEIEKVMIFAPGLIRIEMQNGAYSLLDLTRGRSLFIDPKQKQGTVFEGVGNLPAEARRMNLYEFIRDIGSNAVSKLPVKRIEGRQLPGFLVKYEVPHPLTKEKLTVTLNVWVDPDTKLPAFVEQVFPETGEGEDAPEKIIMDQFVFDEPLEPGLFSFDVPEDYDVTTYGTEKLLPQEDDKDLQQPVLTPKVGLGPVKFGMSMEEVEKLFGKPEKVIPVGESGASVEYYSRGFGMLVSDVLGVSTISANSQTFMAVRVRDFAGQTDKGIRLGSTDAEVREAYGEPSRVEDGTKEGGPKTLYYNDLNGWFSLWNGKVSSMFFSIPRETKLKIFEQRKKSEQPE